MMILSLLLMMAIYHKKANCWNCWVQARPSTQHAGCWVLGPRLGPASRPSRSIGRSPGHGDGDTHIVGKDSDNLTEEINKMDL